MGQIGTGLKRLDAIRLAGTAGVDVKTVVRAYSGLGGKETVRGRIVEAAEKLGLPPPSSETATTGDKPGQGSLFVDPRSEEK